MPSLLDADPFDCAGPTLNVLLQSLPALRATSHEGKQSPIRVARIARMAGSYSGLLRPSDFGEQRVFHGGRHEFGDITAECGDLAHEC